MFEFGSYAAIEQLFVTLSLVMPRMLGCFSVIPFLSRKMLTGIVIRNGFFVSMTIILIPMHYKTLQGVDSLSYGIAILILAKELFIGVVIGLMVSIPFWAVESVGFFIDNQRGATLASTLNPLSGDQTSPMGILLEQSVVILFFVSGTIFIFFKMMYMSYVHWPVLDLSLDLSLEKTKYFLDQLDFLMMVTVVLAGPIVLGMFISEFSFALVNRFTPSLNVFILSMPVKSAVSLVLLVMYINSFYHYLGENTQTMDEVFLELHEVFFG